MPTTALVVAHPGHELRVFGWLETVRPRVFVLTDGSGATGAPRLETTTRLLEHAGADPGSIYGRFTDGEVYEAMLARRTGTFVALAEELAGALDAEEIGTVVGDAAEGHNATHDVCRLVVDAAVALSRARRRAAIDNLEFRVTRQPEDGRGVRAGGRVLRLDDAAFHRKLTAARVYAELDGDVRSAVARFGAEAFRIEVLRPAGSDGMPPHVVPDYEWHGERRVAEGKYRDVIRRDDHVRPIGKALERRVKAIRARVL
jgi:hypothetical protein